MVELGHPDSQKFGGMPPVTQYDLSSWEVSMPVVQFRRHLDDCPESNRRSQLPPSCVGRPASISPTLRRSPPDQPINRWIEALVSRQAWDSARRVRVEPVTI